MGFTISFFALTELQILGQGFITSTTKDTGHGYLSKQTDEIQNKFIFILDISDVGGGQTSNIDYQISLHLFITSSIQPTVLKEPGSLKLVLPQYIVKNYG